MENRRRKDPFYGDSVNSLAKEDNDFRWSASYQWFLNKTLE
jgi:hypothetical protein